MKIRVNSKHIIHQCNFHLRTNIVQVDSIHNERRQRNSWCHQVALLDYINSYKEDTMKLLVM
jgi:hypothetical protein